MKKILRKDYALCTLLFLLCLAGCFAYNIINRISLVYALDGLDQHLTYLSYNRARLLNFLKGEGALFGFDYSLGFGMDAVPNLNWYGLGDVFTLISLLFPADRMESAYTIILCVKLYCACTAMLAYLHKMNVRGTAAITAAVVYCFSGSFVLAAVEHGMFANGILYLPLFLLGFERLLQDKKGFLLSAGVLLNALSGYYFLYANSLMLFVYALVRVIGTKEHRAKFVRILLVSVLYYAIGILLACPVLLPSVKSLLSSGRVGPGKLPPLRYSLSTYAALLVGFAGWTGKLQVLLCMCVPCLFAFVLLLTQKGKWQLKLLTFITIAAAVCPAAIFVLGGFSGNTNRWGYGCAAAMSCVLAFGFDGLLRLSAPQKRLTACAAAFIAVLGIAFGLKFSHFGYIAAAEAVIGVGAILLLNRGKLRGKEAVLCAVCLLMLICNTVIAISDTYTVTPTVPAGQAQQAASEPAYEIASKEGFARIEVSNPKPKSNAAAMTGKYGTSVYNSTMQENLKSAFTDWELGTRPIAFDVTGLDRRSALCAVWCVGTLADRCGSSAPFGFEFEKETDGVRFFRAAALPVGYIMTDVMEQSVYDSLSPLNKQWALLQCAVSEDGGNALPENNDIPLDCTYTMVNVRSEGRFLLAEKDARIDFVFDAPPQSEVYLELTGIEIPDTNVTTFTAASELGLAYGYAQDRDYLYYSGCSDILINLGYAEDGLSSCSLTLPEGRYAFDELRVRCQDLSRFADLTDRLRKNGLTDVSVSKNGSLSGRVKLEEDAVMVFSVPMCDGWSAEIDGKSAVLTDSANIFPALKVPAGEHEITLKYRTPWLGAGFALCAAGLCLAAAILILRRRVRRTV